MTDLIRRQDAIAICDVVIDAAKEEFTTDQFASYGWLVGLSMEHMKQELNLLSMEAGDGEHSEKKRDAKREQGSKRA